MAEVALLLSKLAGQGLGSVGIDGRQILEKTGHKRASETGNGDADQTVTRHQLLESFA